MRRVAQGANLVHLCVRTHRSLVTPLSRASAPRIRAGLGRTSASSRASPVRIARGSPPSAAWSPVGPAFRRRSGRSIRARTTGAPHVVRWRRVARRDRANGIAPASMCFQRKVEQRSRSAALSLSVRAEAPQPANRRGAPIRADGGSTPYVRRRIRTRSPLRAGRHYTSRDASVSVSPAQRGSRADTRGIVRRPRCRNR
jgi:hypothetical protein